MASLKHAGSGPANAYDILDPSDVCILVIDSGGQSRDKVSGLLRDCSYQVGRLLHCCVPCSRPVVVTI